MTTTKIFDTLWAEYSERTPSAQKINEFFTSKGNQIFNDHVAFRTFDDPRVNIEVLAKPFIAAGYVENGEYTFEAKKLYAKHYVTGEVIPDALIKKMNDANSFNQGFANVEYMAAAYLDMVDCYCVDNCVSTSANVRTHS